MASRLHQTTALLKGVKTRIYSAVSALHKEAQKQDPYNGFSKTYRKRDEDGEDCTPEAKKVVLVADQVLRQLQKLDTEVFDLTASQEWANMSAKADIVVDGHTLLTGVPVTYLLFLEKQLVDIRTFVEKMPTLDENRDWVEDPNSGLYKTG